MEEIKIFNQKYKVVEKEYIPGDSQTILGEIDYSTNTIKLKAGMTKERKEHTLWHEIIHGILEAQGRIDDNNNESLVDCLATGICCVLNDNDNLK